MYVLQLWHLPIGFSYPLGAAGVSNILLMHFLEGRGINWAISLHFSRSSMFMFINVKNQGCSSKNFKIIRGHSDSSNQSLHFEPSSSWCDNHFTE
jgi:hypothetical protein